MMARRAGVSIAASFLIHALAHSTATGQGLVDAAKQDLIKVEKLWGQSMEDAAQRERRAGEVLKQVQSCTIPKFEDDTSLKEIERIPELSLTWFESLTRFDRIIESEQATTLEKKHSIGSTHADRIIEASKMSDPDKIKFLRKIDRNYANAIFDYVLSMRAGPLNRLHIYASELGEFVRQSTLYVKFCSGFLEAPDKPKHIEKLRAVLRIVEISITTVRIYLPERDVGETP